MDRPLAALPPAEESVAIFPDLAAPNPDQYHTHHARSLKNLADYYSELGRLEDAETARKEAADTES